MTGRLIPTIYIVVGIAIATSYGFLVHADRLRPIISAVLAVLFWPLVLAGLQLHLR